MIIMLYDYLITLIPFEQVTLQSDIKNRPWILCPGIFKNQRELHKACEMQSGTTWLPQIIDSSVDNLYPSSLIRMHYAGVHRLLQCNNTSLRILHYDNYPTLWLCLGETLSLIQWLSYVCYCIQASANRMNEHYLFDYSAYILHLLRHFFALEKILRIS